jgi:hypothetical protein
MFRQTDKGREGKRDRQTDREERERQTRWEERASIIYLGCIHGQMLLVCQII